MTLPLVLTCGDPGGIGPELILKAWQIFHLCTYSAVESARKIDKNLKGLTEKQSEGRTYLEKECFFVLADPDHLTYLTQQLNLPVPIQVVSPSDPSETRAIFKEALPVVPLNGCLPHVSPASLPSSLRAQVSLESLDRAIQYVHEKKACAVVTNPVTKFILYEAGFPDPGQTEYLARVAHQYWTPAPPAKTFSSAMMLWSEECSVLPVTGHIPLAQVSKSLSKELVVRQASLAFHALKAWFQIPNPRIALAALNPHGGEGGHLGQEEEKILIPALQSLQRAGVDISGPYPADTLFIEERRRKYDLMIGMYHDQVLIPAKMCAFRKLVNVTLGLPFIRTSPAHGTAYDIAGQGQADPSSLIQALHLARRLVEASSSSCGKTIC